MPSPGNHAILYLAITCSGHTLGRYETSSLVSGPSPKPEQIRLHPATGETPPRLPFPLHSLAVNVIH